jgi:hypothetical protein
MTTPATPRLVQRRLLRISQGLPPHDKCMTRSGPRGRLWTVYRLRAVPTVVIQVGGIITLLAWGFGVDNLLFGLVPSVGRFTPARPGRADRHAQAHLLSPGVGALALLAWIALLATIGLALNAKRDIIRSC